MQAFVGSCSQPARCSRRVARWGLIPLLGPGRGIMDRMTSYFTGKMHVSKTLHIHMEPESVTKRMDRVRGVAVHNVHETMQDLHRALAEGASLLASSALQRHYCNQWAGARGLDRHIQPVACVLACLERHIRQTWLDSGWGESAR